HSSGQPRAGLAGVIDASLRVAAAGVAPSFPPEARGPRATPQPAPLGTIGHAPSRGRISIWLRGRPDLQLSSVTGSAPSAGAASRAGVDRPPCFWKHDLQSTGLPCVGLKGT